MIEPNKAFRNKRNRKGPGMTFYEAKPVNFKCAICGLDFTRVISPHIKVYLSEARCPDCNGEVSKWFVPAAITV
jgi:DNA-directed RNA polymerase subunit RPC12/RpoP